MTLKLNSNFCDLLGIFRECGVRYLIIGGWAVSVHAQPRATQDLDIFVGAERSKIEALYKALIQFGAPLKNVESSRFLEPDTFFRIGVPPFQLDVFPQIDGVQFDACWARRSQILLDEKTGVTADFISAPNLITAKIASGREQDLADARAIQRAQQQKPGPKA
jgi:hypothetical protein